MKREGVTPETHGRLTNTPESNVEFVTDGICHDCRGFLVGFGARLSYICQNGSADDIWRASNDLSVFLNKRS